jgi:tetratricopeptide (TPR) repeat protein
MPVKTFLFAVTILALLGLGTAPRPAFSEDEASGAPGFGIEDIHSTLEETPKGWSSLTTARAIPAAAPTAGRMLALAKEAGVDTKNLHARARAFTKGEQVLAYVTLIALDAPPVEAFSAALASAAKEADWAVLELGSPLRLVLAWGGTPQDRSALLAWQRELAVRKLLDLGLERRRQAAAEQDEVDFRAATALIEEAGALAPEAGAYQALRGILTHRPGTEDAFPYFRKAISDATPIPARMAWRVFAAGELGLGLLVAGTPEGLTEAVTVLLFAVRNEQPAAAATARFGNRYNLACAYARLGDLDAAFAALEASLALGQAELGDDYAFHYAHCRDKDTDMAALRADARFTALLEKYVPGAEAGHTKKDDDK